MSRRSKHPGSPSARPSPDFGFPASAGAGSRVGSDDESVPAFLARKLRDMILDGHLQPGFPLVESRMAKELRVGQPTLREAFSALELEGLIERTQNRGSSVAKLGRADIAQMARVRVEVEVMAAKELCQAWTPEAQRTLESALQSMRAAAEAGEARSYLRADLAFHAAICRLGGNPFIPKLAAPVTTPLLVAWMEKAPSASELLRDVEGHEAIGEAFKSGDELTVVLAVRQIMEDFWRQDLAAGRPRS